MLKSKITGSVQEVILPDFPDDDNTVTATVTKSRRVSFGTNLVKEFIVGSAVSAQCLPEYEQAFPSSDSSNADSSQSGVESGILDHRTFPVHETHKVQKPVPQLESEAMENRPKLPKFSSTVCFSADSPTADMEFTEGCITLAKSILDKKNKEMTVIIQAKSKEPKDDEKPKEEETKYFDGSQFDMSVTRCLKSKLNKREEKKFDGEKTKIFSKYENAMSITRCNRIFDEDDSSSDWEDSKENRMPLDMIMRHLDKDSSDLENVLFNPEKTFTNFLNPFDTSNESEDLNLNESMEISSDFPPNIVKLVNNKSRERRSAHEDCDALVAQREPTHMVATSLDDNYKETSLADVVVNNRSTERMDIDESDYSPAAERQPTLGDVVVNKSIRLSTKETYCGSPTEKQSFIAEVEMIESREEQSLEPSTTDALSNKSIGRMSVEEPDDIPTSDKEGPKGEVEKMENTPVHSVQASVTKDVNKSTGSMGAEEPHDIPTSDKEADVEMIENREVNSVELSVTNDVLKSAESMGVVEPGRIPTTEKEEIKADVEMSENREVNPIEPSARIDMNESTGIMNSKGLDDTPTAEKEPITAHVEMTETVEQSKETPSTGTVENLQQNKSPAAEGAVKLVESLEQQSKELLLADEKAIENLEEQKEMSPAQEDIMNFEVEEQSKKLSSSGDEVFENVKEKSEESLVVDFNEVETVDVPKEVFPATNEEVQEIKSGVEKQSKELFLADDKVVDENSKERFQTDVEVLDNKKEKPRESAKIVDSLEEKSKEPTLVDVEMTEKIELPKDNALSDNEEQEIPTNLECAKGREKQAEEPSLVDVKVVESLEEQSKEPQCMWSLKDIRHPQPESPGLLSFQCKILESFAIIQFTLKISIEDSLDFCSTVPNSEIHQQEENGFRLPEYNLVVDFGFEKLKKYFGERRAKVETIRHIPYFLDEINSFALKMNAYLNQVYSIMTLYPGSGLKGSRLSFRLYSFPIFFSSVVSIDLSDLFRLSNTSLSFEDHFGSLNKNKIREIFKNCLKAENSLCEFIIQSTKYIIDLEKESGFVSKREHIGLLPDELK